MRRPVLKTIFEAVKEAEDAKPKSLVQTSLDYWVGEKGASTAAWLIFKHRRRMRGTRVLDFAIPEKHVKKLPPWFQVAMETLRRSRRWVVTEFWRGPAAKRTKVFRVRWMPPNPDPKPVFILKMVGEDKPS